MRETPFQKAGVLKPGLHGSTGEIAFIAEGYFTDARIAVVIECKVQEAVKTPHLPELARWSRGQTPTHYLFLRQGHTFRYEHDIMGDNSGVPWDMASAHEYLSRQLVMAAQHCAIGYTNPRQNENFLVFRVEL